MVGLDGGRSGAAALDDIGVERALHQELGATHPQSLFFKDPHKLVANNFALRFGVGNAQEFRHETFAGIDVDEFKP